jgi:hypothetical protein
LEVFHFGEAADTNHPGENLNAPASGDVVLQSRQDWSVFLFFGAISFVQLCG